MNSPTERPLLKGEAETRDLWQARRRDYQEADIVISVPGEDEPLAMVELIVQALMENPCVT